MVMSTPLKAMSTVDAVEERMGVSIAKRTAGAVDAKMCAPDSTVQKRTPMRASKPLTIMGSRLAGSMSEVAIRTS